MALGDPYATLDELRSHLGITDVADSADDTKLTDALAAASRGIDKVCGRTFNDAVSTSARVYRARDWFLTSVDDFSTTTGLVVATDEDDDGTYETTWSTSDYGTEPLNGVVDGESGWPFWQITAVGSRYFPSVNGPWWSRQRYRWRPFPLRASVQVTARWGWAAVPAPVHQACLLVAAEVFKLKDAPFGVAGFDQYGPVRVRANPVAMGMLAPYERDPVLMA